jgi:Protein of unknown function (DUF2652)
MQPGEGSKGQARLVTLPAQPMAAAGPLLLADISGYTAFLRDVATAHADDAFAGGAIPDAYAMLSSLLGAIVERLVPPFTLSKLEGDAVFAYATDDHAIAHGAELLGCIDACYRAFRDRLATARGIWSCTCDACLRIESLDLKFIVHGGSFVVQEIAGRPELIGPEVVMAHRLLKTEAAGLIGQGAYALLTDTAAASLEVATDGALPLEVRFDHYPPIATWIFPLRAA